ncbi:MAG: transporter [Proteobacteria bacterium]|nr:transporter [Pseudomonadota bacterium]
MKKAVRGASGLALCVAAAPAFADDPGFDRPGISIATTVIPRGAFAIELGVPDFSHVSDRGSSSTSYPLDANLRIGLGGDVELQLAAPVFNYEESTDNGASRHATGVGDLTLSVKVALPTGSERLGWAALAGVTFATGASALTAGTEQFHLANALSYDLNDTYSLGFYVALNYSDGRLGYRVSPNFNLALTQDLSGYVEVGYDHAQGESDATVAGGGLAWMIRKNIQLDASLDAGVSRHAPDLQGGIGISIYFE